MEGLRDALERAPVKLTDTVLAASATAYYPKSGGQDRLGTTLLVQQVRAEVWADKSGTLTLEESNNASSWTSTGAAVTVSASTWAQFPWTPLQKRYWRWKYVNDGTVQGAFWLYEDKTSTPGRTQTSPMRSPGILHRSAISAVDKVSAPGTITLSGQTISGGTLAFGTTYYASVVAVSLQPGSGQIIGLSTIASVVNASPGGANDALRLAWAAVTNADGYLLFLSTDAAPKMVAYITAAQHAAGGEITTEFGTPAAGGAANSMDVGVVGTGLQTNNAIFTANTAHLPDVVAATAFVDCSGFSKAILHARVRMSKTATWSVAPALTIIPWVKTRESTGDWVAKAESALTLLADAHDSLQQEISVNVDGAVGLVTTVSTITGCTADVWVELV